MLLELFTGIIALTIAAVIIAVSIDLPTIIAQFATFAV